MQVERHGSLLIVLLGILMVEAGSSRKGMSIKFGRLLVLSAADDSRKKIAQAAGRVRQLFPAQTTTNDARQKPTYPNAWYNLGKALAGRGQNAEAFQNSKRR
jgi:hypothetical protein